MLGNARQRKLVMPRSNTSTMPMCKLFNVAGNAMRSAINSAPSKARLSKEVRTCSDMMICNQRNRLMITTVQRNSDYTHIGSAARSPLMKDISVGTGWSFRPGRCGNHGRSAEASWYVCAGWYMYSS